MIWSGERKKQHHILYYFIIQFYPSRKQLRKSFALRNIVTNVSTRVTSWTRL